VIDEPPRALTRVTLFGSVEVVRGTASMGPRDFGGAKPKQLFELLVLARGETVPKDRLADLIWPGEMPVHVNATLETYVSVVRRKLAEAAFDGPSPIVTRPEAYAMPGTWYELDLDRFDELVRLADVADLATRRRHLEAALALARGPVLADEPYADWAIDERRRYAGRVLDAAVCASEAALVARDAHAALSYAELALAADDLDERAYRAGMLALYALGREREAEALYDRCATSLQAALGSPTSDRLRELRAAIQRREPVPPPAANGNGHAKTEAPLPLVRLLGRTAELDVLRQILAATANQGSELVLLEGELGIGKTTLLQAACRDLSGVRVGWARCSGLIRGVPYAPLAMALREILAESEVDVRELPALSGVFPELRLRELPPVPANVDVLESIVALVSELAPLVLVIDDLQWADPDTLVALEYLASRKLHGVTVVGAVRLEELEADDLLVQLRPTVRLRVGPLDEQDLAPLGIHDLHQRTDGHPLFVSLAIAGAPGAEPTMADWVAGRCRAAGRLAHRILTVAALLEEPFSAGLVAAVLCLAPVDVAYEVDRLCERRLLCVDGVGFRFRTRVLRDAIAKSTSPAVRDLVDGHSELSHVS
jgi:DNA-binding SARP family transcriptional activator